MKPSSAAGSGAQHHAHGGTVGRLPSLGTGVSRRTTESCIVVSALRRGCRCMSPSLPAGADPHRDRHRGGELGVGRCSTVGAVASRLRSAASCRGSCSPGPRRPVLVVTPVGRVAVPSSRIMNGLPAASRYWLPRGVGRDPVLVVAEERRRVPTAVTWSSSLRVVDGRGREGPVRRRPARRRVGRVGEHAGRAGRARSCASPGVRLAAEPYLLTKREARVGAAREDRGHVLRRRSSSAAWSRSAPSSSARAGSRRPWRTPGWSGAG